MTNNNIDKLVDANGNFVQQALPYTENFLEPYMDSETVTFALHISSRWCDKSSEYGLKKN